MVGLKHKKMFNQVYCIHLQSSTDRKPLIEQELNKLPIGDVQYISAKQPPSNFSMNNMRRNPSAEFGCNLSHIKAINTAIINNNKSALFVEDDIVFVDKPMDKILSANIPNDYDLIYLDGHPRYDKATRINNAIVKVKRFCFASAYIMTRKTMLSFLNYWYDRITQPNAMFDFILGDFSATVNSYAFYPVICKQRTGYSIIGKKHDDKTNLYSSWEKLLTNKEQ